MRKIIVTIPKIQNQKWKVSFGKNSRITRTSSVLVYKAIERTLLASSEGVKTSIVVRYDENITNETLASTDPAYLLYTLSCFLEDFLPNRFLRAKEKRYCREVFEAETP